MLEAISLPLLIAVAVIALYIYVTSGPPKAKVPSSIPGPPGHWFIGNLLDMRSQNRVLMMQKWAKQYGPVFVVRVFNQERVIVNNYDEISEVLVTKGRAFGGKMNTFRLNMVFKGKNIFFNSLENPQLVPMRKAGYRAIRHYADGMNRLENLLSLQMADFVTSVRKYNGKEFNLKQDMYDFIIRIAATMQCGRLVKVGNEIVDHVKRLEVMRDALTPYLSPELDWFPWLRHFGHPTFKKIKQGIQILDELWKEFCEIGDETYTSEGDPSCTVNAIRQLVDPKSAHYDPTIDDDNLKGVFLDLFLASINTTSTTLYALPNLLLHHKEVCAKLREEVDRVVGHDRLPSIFDREAMPYACATILELLRHTSTAPLGMRKTIEETSVGGHKLPPGIVLHPFYWQMHHDEAFWGDPYAFRPERFLEEDGSIVPGDHPRRKHLMPFGNGPRVCVGETFAVKRLFIFGTTLVQAFDLEFGEKVVPFDSRKYDLSVMLSQPPYGIKLIPRRV